MITAGPPIEDIDPVRFISNRSSGKMGYAIAEAAIKAGAEVTLISGPTQLEPPLCKFHAVKSAEQMFNQVIKNIDSVDIFIACAAVADYRVEQVALEKIKKKKQDNLQLNLTKNPDIIKQVAKIAKDNVQGLPFCVAFAAETNDLKSNAQLKLINKGVDLIAANQVGLSANGNNLGFDQNDNELLLLWPEGEMQLKKSTKHIIAQQLIKKISQLYTKKIKHHST